MRRFSDPSRAQQEGQKRRRQKDREFGAFILIRKIDELSVRSFIDKVGPILYYLKWRRRRRERFADLVYSGS
jgi:hypothetical protein